MTAVVFFRLQPIGYWLHASGEGGGADFDLVMERDDDGLPLLRGRHVTGLLHLALRRAVAWEWLEPDVRNLLMGGKGGIPGCLDIRSARMPAPLRQHLLADAAVKAACFHRLATTAIDERGVAMDKHLRAIEVAIPLPLVFAVTFDPTDRRVWAKGRPEDEARLAAAEEHWRDWLDQAMPALDEVGAKRTRGFGRLALVEKCS